MALQAQGADGDAALRLIQDTLENRAPEETTVATSDPALDLSFSPGSPTQSLMFSLRTGAESQASGAANQPAFYTSTPNRSLQMQRHRSRKKPSVTARRPAAESPCASSKKVTSARQKGLPVDDQIARQQLQTIAVYLDGWRDRALQGIGIPGDADTISYILLGMAAENYRPDPATDAMARLLKWQQVSDGRWRILAHRPPIESSDIQVTAASMRAMQVYMPASARAEYQPAVRRAAAWLAKQAPATTEERAFQLLGLGWGGAGRALIRQAGRALVAEQRSDGGWAQTSWLASDAYATGQALVALAESGALSVSAPAYRRGVQFLMNTQFADGSWFVPTRALPIQPHFESGFPYGRDQFISAAATNWAARALALAYVPAS